ncbi:hypothetical protein ACIBSV_23565 [Embleya sp. NPDC050154]|uniref:hypothetical protein n=1 Tax=Embleya sp. NPDC050154 TaxID=3363988 RepID=UPI0037B7817E
MAGVLPEKLALEKLSEIVRATPWLQEALALEFIARLVAEGTGGDDFKVSSRRKQSKS